MERRALTGAARGDGGQPSWLHAQGAFLLVDVLVTPRAPRTRIMGVHDCRLKIQVAAPPADGKANEALVRFLAAVLEVARAQVEIVGGTSGRRKTVRLQGVSLHSALMRLTPVSG